MIIITADTRKYIDLNVSSRNYLYYINYIEFELKTLLLISKMNLNE